jgi:hypothetical protein
MNVPRQCRIGFLVNKTQLRASVDVCGCLCGYLVLCFYDKAVNLDGLQKTEKIFPRSARSETS